MKAIALIVLSLFSFSASATLSQQQIHAIQNGWHAPFSDETVKQVIDNQKVYIPEYKFQVDMHIAQGYWEEPADKWMWVLFWGLQLADIYSTHEGVKYDCISEANPLLPEIPTVGEMALLKGVILLPTYSSIGWDNFTRADLIFPLLIGGAVVNHNIRLVHKAEKRCNLR